MGLVGFLASHRHIIEMFLKMTAIIFVVKVVDSTQQVTNAIHKIKFYCKESDSTKDETLFPSCCFCRLQDVSLAIQVHILLMTLLERIIHLKKSCCR